MPDDPTWYVTLTELQAAVQIDSGIAEADVERALNAASRAIDAAAQRRFWKDDVPTVRQFRPHGGGLVVIDDLADGDVTVTVDGVEIDGFDLEPFNAPADGRPYTSLTMRHRRLSRDSTVEVDGLWGWPQVPAQVPQLTVIIASKLLKRSREAPFGVISVGGIDASASRIAREDPDLQMLLGPLMRNRPAVA